ncbi:hypothetical protein Y032_0077g1104 [Ancylostoma ceylanicum]|uniref:Retinal pigment epithelial membrane protein n=2 Tax=Ancylostoma ceylanicum TaxID=53326 RepID=A0A016TUE1_9BILA|nr:hypothetical protein Y032_0077g1104 [Ancylostoma ceylanicum]
MAYFMDVIIFVIVTLPGIFLSAGFKAFLLWHQFPLWLASYFHSDRCIDNCSVAFTTVGDGVYALTESPYLARIDIDTLDYLEKVDIREPLKLSLHTYSAHCHSDAEGNLYNIGSMFGPSSKYIFARTENPLLAQEGPSGRCLENTELLGMVTATDTLAPSYYHSFGITENYIILFESPERINMKKLMFSKLLAISFNECMYWDENKSVNVILFDRVNRKPVERKVTSDAFFTFHHANAFEKDGFIVVDYCKYDNPGNFDDLLLEHMRSGSFIAKDGKFLPFLHRMIIPINVSEDSKPGDDLLSKCEFANGCQAILREDGSIHCVDTRISDISFEFPRYCYDLNMKDYRYVYGAHLGHDKEAKHGVVKVDLSNGTNKVWLKDAGDQLCAEPILVNRPEYVEEDEGVLLVPVVTTNENDTPYVVVLNAQTMEELGRFLIPQSRIPLGFHAHYVPRPDL